jgi:signal peptidase II
VIENNDIAPEAASVTTNESITPPKENLWHGILFLVIISGLIVALDQWTKWLVLHSLDYSESWNPWDWLTPYARIVHWQNSGIALGMFQKAGKVYAVLPIIVSFVIVYYFFKVSQRDWPLRLAMAMQLGGALGNLIDRLRFGYVIDFISVWNFPVFNVADSSVTVGVIILLLAIWITERKEQKNAAAGLEPAGVEISKPGEHAAGE